MHHEHQEDSNGDRKVKGGFIPKYIFLVKFLEKRLERCLWNLATFTLLSTEVKKEHKNKLLQNYLSIPK